MNPRMVALLLTILPLAGCESFPEIKNPFAGLGASHSGGGHGKHWEYTGAAGPEHWGDLDPEFSTCKTGKEQSPIDIRTAEKAALESIRFNYTSSSGEIVNNGHTIQVNLESAGTIRVASGEYQLAQFHFHAPSEEQFNGASYPMVAHLVHRTPDKEIAVIAVEIRAGNENRALKAVFDAMPTKSGEKKPLTQTINANDLLPGNRAYYAFAGSFTTPPCTEGIRWHVLKQPIELSEAQIAAFKKLYPMNVRPVQPLNGRRILESQQ